MGKRFLLLLSVLRPVVLLGAAKESSVTISSQADFDALSARIAKLAKDGVQSIDVTVREGV